jgi:hypothetical protein
LSEPDVGETEMVNAPVVAAVTVSDTVAVCVIPPPVPVTVMVDVPAAAVEATVNVKVEEPEPGAAMDVGLNAAVTPVGRPDADKETAELKPPETVVLIVEFPLLPCTTETAVGEADSVNAGVAAAVTVSVTVAVCVIPPPVPVTVIGYVPVAVVDATVSVALDVPEPGAAIDVGLKLTVTPAGWPEADKATAESNPPEIVVLMVELPLEPTTTETAVGEAARVNAGV